MPFLAILRYDLKTLIGSWMVRLWLAGTALLTLLILLVNWGSLQSSLLIATLLFPYLVLPWFLVVMILGVEPVAGSRVEVLADGILSRPVTRYEYLLAVWAARVALVLGGFLLVMVPAVILVATAHRRAPEDHVTIYGVVASLGVVGLVLTLQVSLAFLAGTVLRRPLLAIVVLLACWYPVDAILDAFSVGILFAGVAQSGSTLPAASTLAAGSGLEGGRRRSGNLDAKRGEIRRHFRRPFRAAVAPGEVFPGRLPRLLPVAGDFRLRPADVGVRRPGNPEFLPPRFVTRSFPPLLI